MYFAKKKDKEGIYWGWYVVAGAFLALSINYGARYCFGVFVKPLAVEYGWSRTVISLGASFNMLIYSACSIVVGRIVDRVAPRWIIAAGALLTALSFFLTSFIKTPLQFYLVYGIMAGIGSSAMGVVVSNSSVGKWFVRKRGLALGISTMGIGFGTILLTPTAGYIVKHSGWKAGFLFLSLAVFLIGIVVSQLLMRRTDPETYGLLPDGDVNSDRILKAKVSTDTQHFRIQSLFSDSRFWLLGLSSGLSVTALMSVYVHQVAYAQDYGIDEITAASFLSVIGLAGFLGQFFFGWFSDRIKDPKYSMILGIFFMLAGMFILLKAANVRVLYVYALIYGFGYGSLTPLMPIITAHRFGRHVLGSVYGLLTFFTGLGGSIGPVFGSIIYDRYGSYTYVWQADIIILMVVVCMLLMLKPGHPSARVEASGANKE